MSTRCQIIVKDEESEQWFYRHSDGYPDGVMPILEIFLKWAKEGKIRRNVEQACGWLILLGAIEDQTLLSTCFPEGGKKSYDQDRQKINNTLDCFEPNDWKVGAFEICPCKEQHGDIEYLYIVDLEKLTIEQKEI